MITHCIVLLSAVLSSKGDTLHPDEAGNIGTPVLLTDPAFFLKAGESYFDPAGKRVIFQAIEHPVEGEEPVEEAKYKYSQKGGRSQKRGGKVGSEQASPYGSFKESRNSRKPVVRRKPKTDTVSETKIMKEYKELKSKNNEYKKALNVFKDKLNEVALFNTNLAYVNRLFTEHSTTKKEKMEILYEGVLDHLIMHQEDLSMSDRVKLLQSLSNYILPKTKPVRDEFTFDKLIEIKKEGVWSDTPDPTK